MVLHSGTMLHFAQNMKKIGQLYYSSQNKQRAMDLAVATKKELNNAKLRLANQGFDDEIEIMDNYIKALGQELRVGQKRMFMIAGDVEISPPMPERSLHESVQNLLKEITLILETKTAGVVAVSGFSTRDDKRFGLLEYLSEMALMEIANHESLKVVERETLASVIEEQKLSLSGLMDSSRAIEVGKLLSANYILTGTVIEMSTSVVIFGRIINVVSGEVEAVAQVIVSKDKEVNELLARSTATFGAVELTAISALTSGHLD